MRWNGHVVILLLLACAAPIAAQCGSAGTFGVPQIAVTNDVVGRLSTFEMSSARPGAAYVWAADVSSGPTILPFGILCLGPAPLVVFDSVSGGAPLIGPSGTLSIPMVIPESVNFLSGVPFAMQAVVVDPAGANNIAISNGITFTPRSPRFFILAPGTTTPFGITPGNIIALDIIDDLVAWHVVLPAPAHDIARSSSRRWILVMVNNDTLNAFDEETGAPVLTMPLTPGPGIVSRLGVTPDGNRAIISYTGTTPTPFGGGTPGAVRVIDLVTQTDLGLFPLPAGTTSDMVVASAGTHAYLRVTNSIVPFDWLGLTFLPAVQLGGTTNIVDWTDAFGLLFVLFGQSGAATTEPSVNAIDAINAAPLFPVPQIAFGAGFATKIRGGPGSGGPALMLLAPNTGAITEMSVSNFAVMGGALAPGGTTLMEPSSDGTGWVLVRPGGTGPPFTPPANGTLLDYDPTTFTVTPIDSLPAESQHTLLIQHSDVRRRAFVMSGNTTMLPAATDPLQPVGTPIVLPAGSGVFRVVER